MKNLLLFTLTALLTLSIQTSLANNEAQATPEQGSCETRATQHEDLCRQRDLACSRRARNCNALDSQELAAWASFSASCPTYVQGRDPVKRDYCAVFEE